MNGGKFPVRFPETFPIPKIALVVLFTTQQSTRQADHKYRVRYGCCEREREMSHTAILKRWGARIVLCPACASKANGVSQKGIPVHARVATKPTRRKREVEVVAPAWPVPASVAGKRRAR